MGFGLGRKDDAASAPATPHGHESKWAKRAMGLSDKLGGAVNSYGQKWGLEAFWPTSGDFPAEMDKAAKILRSFTVEAPAADAGHHAHAHKYAKIPPSVVRDAKGIAVYTCVRAGVAPWGGAGGSGLVVARLPDGSWSAPAAIMPTSMTAGLQIGLDVYDAVLIIRTEEALRQFGSHRFSLGADVSVAAGPRGAGQGAEGSFGGKRDHDGKVDKGAQVYSYMRSKGVYAGIEVVGTAFISRADENEAMYHAPGIKPADILSGRVPSPPAAQGLNLALQAAETGYAQAPGFAQYGPNDTAATVGGGAPPLPPRQVEQFSKPSAMDYDSGAGAKHGGPGGPGGPAFGGAAAAYNAGAFSHQNQGGDKGSGAYGQQNSYGQPSAAYGQPGAAYGQPSGSSAQQAQSGFAPPGGFAPPAGPPPTRFTAPAARPPPPAGPPPAYHE